MDKPEKLADQISGSRYKRWKYSVSVYKYLQTCDDTINIKFEDLLLHPEITLQKVCKFLGVFFEKKCLMACQIKN